MRTVERILYKIHPGLYRAKHRLWSRLVCRGKHAHNFAAWVAFSCQGCGSFVCVASGSED